MNLRSPLLFAIAVMILVNLYVPVSQAQTTINIDAEKIIGQNRLTLGFQNDHTRWIHLLNNQTYKELVTAASIQTIRFFDFRYTANPTLSPCINWNSTTKTGSWNWKNVDEYVSAIYASGSEPLIALSWAGHLSTYPTGMAINLTTGLPTPEDWASYCAEWVKHFKQTNAPVRLYEVTNEPLAYLKPEGNFSETKADYFKEMYSAAVSAMKKENNNILVSFVDSTNKKILDYWLENEGMNLDFLSFNKYDSNNASDYLDEQLFDRAEKYRLESDFSNYGVKEAQLTYYQARGVTLPVFASELNLCSIYFPSTDPRIHEMVGATWLGLALRKSILTGLDKIVYYEMSGTKNATNQNPNGTAWGFGMVDGDTNQPWLPYFVYKMLGQNIDAGDSIVESTTSDTRLRILAWKHEEQLKLLIINRSHDQITINISGWNSLKYEYIDETMPSDNPTLAIGSASNAILKGYTVMLIQPTNQTPTIPEFSISTFLVLMTTTTAIISIMLSKKLRPPRN